MIRGEGSLGRRARIDVDLLELPVIRLFPVENLLHPFAEDQVLPGNLILFRHIIIDRGVSLVFVPLVHSLVNLLKTRATLLAEHRHDLLVLGLDFH